MVVSPSLSVHDLVSYGSFSVVVVEDMIPEIFLSDPSTGLVLNTTGKIFIPVTPSLSVPQTR